MRIFPQPQSIQQTNRGSFKYTESLEIIYSPNISHLFPLPFLKNPCRQALIPDDSKQSAQVLDTLKTTYPNSIIAYCPSKSASNEPKEWYQLEIDDQGIFIVTHSSVAIIWAFQSLRQLIDTSATLNSVIISDHPAFKWRGCLLDCSRHFMSVDFVKRFIDMLSYHKMNILHWHIVDDQGWRVPIDSWPKLTTVGGYRQDHTDPGKMYGGFYTKEQIREIVGYADKVGVEVIPEIELPGHSRAALAAYPQLSCTGVSQPVPNTWGIFEDVYCPGNPETFEFLEKVLDEVIGLFPSKLIHIGGDEVPKTRWSQCTKCQHLMKREKLANEEELQSYFVRRIAKYLSTKGRSIIGWDEVLEGGLAKGCIVQSWRGYQGAIEASNEGHDSIVSPTSHCYFDYPLTTTDLAKVYSFDPIPSELPPNLHKHIMGGECCMWSERAPEPLVMGKVYPRLCALVECLWKGKEGRETFDQFQHDLQATHYPRLAKYFEMQ